MDRLFKSYPLSVAQTGMWVKEKLSPSDLSFVLAESLEIHGAIQPDIFCAALQQLFQEVEAIRLQIIEVDGKPRQIVSPPTGRHFDVFDYSDLPDAMDKAYRWMRADMVMPLDLEESNLWSSSLFKISEQHWIWYHRAHHILIDGFSGGLLARRVADIYSALKRGDVPAACDFGSLQELLDSETHYRTSAGFERDRAYWCDQLKSLSTPVTLSRRDAKSSGGLLRLRATLDRTEVQRLQRQAKAVGASLPQALIATVAAYYARATDCSDLTMVTMVTGRISSAVRRIPGMVANAVPLRFNVTPEVTWQDLVRQSSSQMMRALRYQRYRYEDLRRDVGTSGQEEQIARLGVNIEPFDYDLRFDGHPVTAHNLSNGTMTDFTIFAYDRGDGSDLTIDFDANPALYTLEELQDHKERFFRMIGVIADHPSQAISTISLLQPEERQKLLHDWNDTQIASSHSNWIGLFKRQVETRPDATAVIFEDKELTYAQLDAMSDRLAQVLRRRGIGRGDLAAIAMPRSEDMLVALLAVLKSGAAYLPLDPADPEDRLLAIIEDGKPGIILSISSANVALPSTATPVVFVDDVGFDDLAEGFSFESPSADDTAYVIFTSGSTGRPKGVEIAHGSLVNFLEGMQDLLALTPQDRIVAVTTIAFDIATLELFLPLTVGAATVIATRRVVKDPAALNHLIKSRSVSVMQATPSLWRMLLNEYPTELEGLRPLVGGEALPRDLAHALAKLGHPVVNLYGPTETTVWSSCMPLLGDDLDSVPIGRPIRNTTLYVLDKVGQPVPPGSIGELHIGGAGVAKGYLHQPDLTAERFLADPFRKDGGRIYKTGDLARWREDGVLEYLGRNDHQIKIRGFRVEPGEIESAITAEEHVKQAVVVVRDEPGRNKQLVAYLVSTSGASIDTARLSKRLADVLPSHMIPAAFVVMESLPLNTNGKIDRRALPAPEWKKTDDHVAPRTPVERLLADLWCGILGVPTVSINDDFFQLGGDSLAAASMISALSRKFDGDILWSGFLESPTIAGFSRHLETPQKQKASMAPVLPIRAKGHRAPLFCIHPVMGLGWAFTSLAQHIPDDIPIYAFQADAVTGRGKPSSVKDIATLYLERMRDIQPQGPYSILGWSFGGLIAHELTRQLEQSGEEIAFLGLLDAYPFVPPSGQSFYTEATLAKAALGFLGFDETIMGDNPGFAALGDFLAKEYGLRDNVFFAELLREDPAFMDTLRSVILHHLSLAQTFVPGKIKTPIHFISARPPASRILHAVLKYGADHWLPHAAGGMYRYAMDAAHEDMLEHNNAKKIADVFLQPPRPSTPRFVRVADMPAHSPRTEVVM